jgi:hypothetical protein
MARGTNTSNVSAWIGSRTIFVRSSPESLWSRTCAFSPTCGVIPENDTERSCRAPPSSIQLRTISIDAAGSEPTGGMTVFPAAVSRW